MDPGLSWFPGQVQSRCELNLQKRVDEVHRVDTCILLGRLSRTTEKPVLTSTEAKVEWCHATHSDSNSEYVKHAVHLRSGSILANSSQWQCQQRTMNICETCTQQFRVVCGRMVRMVGRSAVFRCQASPTILPKEAQQISPILEWCVPARSIALIEFDSTGTSDSSTWKTWELCLSCFLVPLFCS